MLNSGGTTGDGYSGRRRQLGVLSLALIAMKITLDLYLHQKEHRAAAARRHAVKL